MDISVAKTKPLVDTCIHTHSSCSHGIRSLQKPITMPTSSGSDIPLSARATRSKRSRNPPPKKSVASQVLDQLLVMTDQLDSLVERVTELDSKVAALQQDLLSYGEQKQKSAPVTPSPRKRVKHNQKTVEQCKRYLT